MAKTAFLSLVLSWFVLAGGVAFISLPTIVLAEETQNIDESAGDSVDPFGDLEVSDDELSEEVVEAEEDDPLEGYNRFMSGFNRVVRGVIIDPLVDTYQAVTPDVLQTAISNAAANATEPLTAGASLLQGDVENAGNSINRFLVNTTVGLGGTSDRASEMGIEARKTDLGLAAGANGVEPGAHVVLPIIGPSNMRDAPGDIATGFIPGLGIAKAVDSASEYSEHQEEIKDMTDSSLDPYATEKAYYEQHRAHEVEIAKEALEKQKMDENMDLAEEPAGNLSGENTAAQ